MGAMVHFLLVYDYQQEKLLTQRVFMDAQEAADAYSEAERENHDKDFLEIVLVGSDSIETIHRTHGHYFTEEPAGTGFLVGV